MKKLLTTFALAAVLALTGCGGTADAPAGEGVSGQAIEAPAKAEEPAPVQEAPKAPDLTGSWKEADSASKETYQQATITADTITVEWVSDGGDTTAVYWVGTFVAPVDATKPYTWSSQRDAAATDMALLASSDDAKDFTFDGDTISYKVTALGTTVTAKLKKG
ncbi:hypothetical protein JOF48_002870 [Arthrobacter stackebrandtii]|uniref:Lipoprotein n=1 Tax=Arthrobacter stackebrandtii TaxID=272161 RepID=A0ABS4YZ47_9MICC|nr:hypothetical protein [Arthrobacter stackebrandtii]MBP2414071.1 hypothetical protein [Arthrobacter stackebrandtii]